MAYINSERNDFMELIRSHHYLIKTDWEMLNSFFDELKEHGIENFDELLVKLEELKIRNANDLLKYVSGDQCCDSLAILGEGLLERLRSAVSDRELIMTSSDEVGTYLLDKFAGHKQEELWAIYIDNSNHIIAEKKLFQGTLDKSIVHPREVFRWAVIYACAGFFVVHNHPSGNLLPSKSDIELTEMLHEAAKLFRIEFLDHFIVGKGNYFSFCERQLF